MSDDAVRVYLDHAATTRLHPDVLAAMLPFWHGEYGNPSSSHLEGRQAKAALWDAKERFAVAVGCSAEEVVWTSGGTESNNLALFGVAKMLPPMRRTIVISAVEHATVRVACAKLAQQGYTLKILSVDEQGKIPPAQWQHAIDHTTGLVSVVHGNHEIATCQDIVSIGQWARHQGALFHVDAVQTLGHEPLDLKTLPVDMMSFSAHKIHGPKGSGALYVHKKVALEALFHGGAQERRKRAGTENVAFAVGFSYAAQRAVAHREAWYNHVCALKQTMMMVFSQVLPAEGYRFNGHPAGVPHILSASFPGVDAQTLLMQLDMEGIAASSGSACAAGALTPSPVLEAIRLPQTLLRSTVRFSFGMDNTDADIRRAANTVTTLVKKLRMVTRSIR